MCRVLQNRPDLCKALRAAGILHGRITDGLDAVGIWLGAVLNDSFQTNDMLPAIAEVILISDVFATRKYIAKRNLCAVLKGFLILPTLRVQDANRFSRQHEMMQMTVVPFKDGLQDTVELIEIQVTLKLALAISCLL